MKIWFFLEEIIVCFPGFIIVMQRLAATIATLIHAASALLYRILASRIHKDAPQSHFLWTNKSMKKEKLKAQYSKSANARFNMKIVVDQLIWKFACESGIDEVVWIISYVTINFQYYTFYGSLELLLRRSLLLIVHNFTNIWSCKTPK